MNAATLLKCAVQPAMALRANGAISQTHSSLVSDIEIALIAGAANTTTGNIAIHATNRDDSQ
jgi:hypothetical protein